MILAFMGLHLKVKCPKSIIPIQRANPCNLIFRALSIVRNTKLERKCGLIKTKLRKKNSRPKFQK